MSTELSVKTWCSFFFRFRQSNRFIRWYSSACWVTYWK